ncbi:MAG: ribonuclease E/G [Caulobacteraceae bacterium]|nr:ribonuclease E/G [Caulobacteraceae bacterium]
MSERRFFLDQGAAQARAVVTLGGLPERLLLARDDEGDDAGPQLGERYRARVRRFEPSLATAFLDLGEGREAVLAARPGEAGARNGQALTVEIKSEARAGKAAVARFLEAAEGAPERLAPAPSIAEQIAALARGQAVEEGPAARAAADEAEAAVLQPVHGLPGGGSIAVEPTRALTAIDVDLGERKAGEGKRAARQANLAALAEGARLLRLKGLGGLVVFDLAGRGHDGPALSAGARAAFAADQPGVAIGPISKFGTLEIVLPRSIRPLAERLGDALGRPTAETLAHRLLRRMEAEAALFGGRLEASAATAVAQAAQRHAPALAARIGARFAIQGEAGWPLERLEVRLA